MLPAEDERRYVVAPARHPICEAVTQEEERCQTGEPEHGPRPRSGFAEDYGSNAVTRCDHALTLSAKETVKIPQSSVNSSTLRKPAASTN